MDNHEDYLDALTAYSRNPTQEIPPILEQYLNGVAKNGETLFQWPLLKPLIVGKMEQVIAELRQGLTSENIPPRPNVENVRFDVMHERIMDALNKFNGAPFTIQRLCELLIDPKRHYKRSDKFMRGLEKNVLVVSTVDPFGRKVVSESGNKHLVNGMDTNGSPFFPRDSNISSNLPPVPGWVTSAVSVATSRQNSPAVDSSDQKPTQQASQDSTLTANGVSSGLVSSVYGDQGEQPLAVHAEEVVEETVVTMDTHEVGSVATGGGEALAEEEDEEEEMGADDTNASSSSSSSSSSEELSASDTSDSSGSKATLSSAVSSSSESPTRPWASIASEGENRRDSVGEPDPNAVTESSGSSEKLSKDSPSKSPPTGDADSLVSSDTSSAISSQTSLSSSDELPAQSETDEAATNTTTQQSVSMDDSFGFEPVTSASAANTTNTAAEDHADQKSESSDSSSMSASDVESENSAGSEGSIPTSTATSTPISSGTQLHPHQPSSEHIRTYAEVVATSSTDSFARNFMPLDPVEECDSVAGLERLVGSVEPSPSPVLAVSSSTSSLSVQSSPTASQSIHKSESHSVTPTSDSPIETEDSEEPQAKRCRLSEEASSPLPASPQSSMVSSSPSDIKTTADLDVPADTTSDSSTTDPVDSSRDENSETKSHFGSDETVSCTSEEAEEAPPAVELGGGDCVTQEQENAATSPPSQLSSSSDSQGFDVCGDTLRKTSIEEKQTNDEVAAGEITPSDETAEGQIVTTESDTGPEPMDQE